MSKKWTNLVTGKDNTTHDVFRWSFVITSLVIIFGFLFNSFKTGLFDLMTFSQSIGVNAGAHGASVAVKQFSGAEPDPIPDSLNEMTQK